MQGWGKRRTALFVVTAAFAAFALLLAGFFALRAGLRSRSYASNFRRAADALAGENYPEAERLARAALEHRKTEEAYLILADAYTEGDGDLSAALDALYRGYALTGSERIAERIETLKARKRAETGDEGSITLADREISLGVRALSLSGLSLSGSDLAPLTALTALEGLDLSDNAISDLSLLAALPSLRSLDLSGNPVGDLAPLAALPDLKTLYLDENWLPDLSPLYGMNALRTLSLTGASFDNGQLETLREALPLCEIHVSEPDDGNPD